MHVLYGVCTCICVYACTSVHVVYGVWCVQVCVCIRVYECTCAIWRIQVCVCVCVYMHVRMYMCYMQGIVCMCYNILYLGLLVVA